MSILNIGIGAHLNYIIALYIVILDELFNVYQICCRLS